jgi:hypothetical protein
MPPSGAFSSKAVNNDPEVDLSRVDGRWASAWVAKNAALVERDGSLPLMNWVKREAPRWSNFAMDDIEPDKRFLISRASPEHSDFFLVNRLISEYLPFDYLTRFIFNKPTFYADYENWPENYRDYVVGRIRDTYLADKKGVRRRLYK